jgi:antitoxin CptB
MRLNMITPQTKAKLIWNCRRGMLELDLMLSRFMKNHVDSLSDTQVSAFEKLLGSSDPELYVWLIGQEKPADKELAEIVAFIRLHNNV